MHLLPALLFAVSSNLDNFVIGISYGIKGIHIHFLSNLLIGGITLAGTLLSMVLGKSILTFLPLSIARLLGSAVILLIGLYCLISFFVKRKKAREEPNWPQANAEKYDRDQSKSIELREAVPLGIALALNNIGLGISASVIGLNIPLTAASAFLFSLLALNLGNKIGNSWLSKLIGRYAEPLSGLIIIALGLYELFV